MATLVVKKEFKYTYTYNISFNKEFLWNTGNLSSYWYQVVGCCKNTSVSSSDSCPPFQTDDATCKDRKSFYFQTLLAYSVEDVCEQLSSNDWNWEICSLKKWSKPAENEYVTDLNKDCNILQEVSFKDIPECVSLSISEKPEMKIKFKMLLTTLYVGSGKISICGDGCSSAGVSIPIQNIFLDPTFTQSEIKEKNINKFKISQNNEVIKIQEEQTVTSPDFEESLNQLSSNIPTIIVSCSECTTLPARLYFKNNLINLNDFSKFIFNNNQEFKSNFDLIYSKNSDSWNKNFYYQSGNRLIKWYTYFDLSCVGESESEYHWQFSMLYKKIENNIVSDTKLSIKVPSEYVCGYNSEFLFEFNFNVNKNYLFTNINYFRDSFTFYDRIGLFSNTYWERNPEIYIKISQNYDPSSTTRKIINY